MPTYSANKVSSFALRVANLLTRKTTDLTAKGYDPTADITALNAGATALPVTDETQESAKTQQITSTAAVEGDTIAAYRKANAALTTATGFFGKASPEADEARRIRGECANDRNPTQVATFTTSVIAFLNTNKIALIAKGWDPTTKITELTPFQVTLTGEKGVQEGKKGARGNATNAVLAAIDALYTSANDKLEGVIGLYDGDPDNEIVKEVRRIRAELRGRDPTVPPEVPPPAPPPPPPPGP